MMVSDIKRKKELEEQLEEYELARDILQNNVYLSETKLEKPIDLINRYISTIKVELSIIQGRSMLR